ncbi:hypothetical protein L228DRAFT_243281 [Xylona heveae TC161]|uniref:Adenylyltransferase and sulfurtransferase uba4 n=1 Tax=Xylona heveae (strain CBS 132557 / TC161) TaxID=1328760 RepID=A0A165JXZ6_XYLHT|nr:hypothetical protein L228DRAFT_243281 [Xylona heveae TC161]KZF26767.1 hypothetical protein L228DRAFT_243281 [Xylona heveae TC161]
MASADTTQESIDSLQARVKGLERELSELKSDLAAANARPSPSLETPTHPDSTDGLTPDGWTWPLAADEYKRYGRQMILPQIGLEGQLKLKSSSVLIVGAGGLGCPAAAYLAGAGVGKLGLVDGDTVEVSNLHRQILHGTHKVDMRKVDSAIQSLKGLNPTIQYVAHREHLTPLTSLDIFAQYDVILDCTDHPTSRYLISDTAVLLGKPLVSASALKTEGQLMVLNDPPLPRGDPSGGPCYRCVFPRPPPAESLVSCGEGGILGPVVGTMGVLQALETIKLITRRAASSSASGSPEKPTPSLLLFSAYGSPPFRSIRLRSRRANCLACSALSPESGCITKESLSSGSLDYVQFCGVTKPVNILAADERVTATEYNNARKTGNTGKEQGVLIDVREKVLYDICHIDNSINIPYSTIVAESRRMPSPSPSPSTPTSSSVEAQNTQNTQNLQEAGNDATWFPNVPSNAPIHVICRLGNDSQLAVRRFQEMGLAQGGNRYIGDIKGGLKAWKDEVDKSWPEV